MATPAASPPTCTGGSRLRYTGGEGGSARGGLVAKEARDADREARGCQTAGRRSDKLTTTASEAPRMSAYKSDFLANLANRGFIHQVSEPEALDPLAASSRITAHIALYSPPPPLPLA